MYKRQVFVLSACGEKSEPAATTAQKASWEEFAATTVAAYYAANPEAAVYAGLHEYDGKISDVSLAANEKYALWIDGVIAEAKSYDSLGGIEAFERDYLLTALEGELFWIRDSGFATNNPVYYASGISADIYIDREYAPIEERIVAYTCLLYTSPSPRDRS